MGEEWRMNIGRNDREEQVEGGRSGGERWQEERRKEEE